MRRLWKQPAALTVRGRMVITLVVLVSLVITVQGGHVHDNLIESGRNCSGAACLSLDDDEPPCPPDSVLVTPAPPTPSPPPPASSTIASAAAPLTSPAPPAVAAGECACAPGRCVTPVCRNGSRRELKQRGSGVPGDCCDVYECVPPREKNCSEVVCPTEVGACPPDSFRLPGRRGPRDCCSVPQGCQCLPRACAPPPRCPAGAAPRRTRAATGRPGACCPAYDCPAASPAPAPPERVRSGGRGVRSHPPLAELAPPPDDLGEDATPPPPPAPADEQEDEDEDEEGAGGAACTLNGRSLEHGLSLRLDACTVCACSNGSVLCHKLCPPLPLGCSRTDIPDGECCPVCVEPAPGSGDARGGGCVTSAGRPMREGQRWQEDACTTCECRGGARRCEAFMCQVACARPRHDPRECCPVCDVWPAHCPEMTCSHQCPFGFEPGDDGCSTCRCKEEPKECSLECPKGFLLDRLGQPLCRCAQPASSSPTSTTTVMTMTASPPPAQPSPACPPLVGCHKNCSHGFRISRQGCPVCRCNQCRPMQPPDCERLCPHGFRANDRGCPICKCKASPDLSSTHGSAVTFTLCKSSDGEVREDGESWFDGCRQCYCHGGTEMCALISCPALSCAAPVFNATGACCPHCRDEAPTAWRGAPAGMVCLGADGRVEGETWRADACTRCVCQGGRALCEAHQCPPAPCAAPTPPRPGACCAECPPAPAPSPVPRRACGRRAHGDAWRETRACRSCVCLDGEAHCFADRCPPTPCARPVLPKNRCCPVCLLDEGISKYCVSGNITYLEGEEWLNDQCTRCICRDGQNVCAPRKCPVLCPNPVNVPDQCCPICPDQAEFTTSAWLEEWKYLLIIGVFLVIFMILLAYICYQCYLNRQPKLDVSPKSCPNPTYNGYTHRNSFPPPRYTSTDRQSKCEAYHYKYVPSYDSQQFDSLKSPSFGASEKTALAPV